MRSLLLLIVLTLISFSSRGSETESSQCYQPLTKIISEDIKFRSPELTKTLLDWLLVLDQKFSKALESHGGLARSELRQHEIELARKYIKKLKPLLNKYLANREFISQVSRTDEMWSLADDERREIVAELKRTLPTFEARAIELTGLSGGNTIIELNLVDGLKGTSEYLAKMYLALAERQGWVAEVLSSSGENADRSLILKISGSNVYQFMQFERGLHRLIVRGDSRTTSKNKEKTHTWVVAVNVYKEPSPQEFHFDLKDIDVTSMKSPGPGGQHVNKTESGIRAVHRPTGLEVKITTHRSQARNKDIALGILKAKLFRNFQLQQELRIQEMKRMPPASDNEKRYIRTFDERRDSREVERWTSDTKLEDDILNKLASALNLKLGQLFSIPNR